MVYRLIEDFQMEDSIVTLTRNEMVERLQRLGIKRVDLDTMLAIVVAFMNGEKNVALYRNRPGGTLGSPNTIVKLRRIYNEKDDSKNLDFLKNEINRKMTQIDAQAEDSGEDVERLINQEYSDGERTPSLSGEEMEEHHEKRFDPFGEFRLGIIQSAEDLLDDFVLYLHFCIRYWS